MCVRVSAFLESSGLGMSLIGDPATPPLYLNPEKLPPHSFSGPPETATALPLTASNLGFRHRRGQGRGWGMENKMSCRDSRLISKPACGVKNVRRTGSNLLSI